MLDDLELRSRQQYVGPTTIARIYVGLDDKQGARKWVEKACLEHDIDLVSTAGDVGLSAVRSDPDFHELFLRVGLVK